LATELRRKSRDSLRTPNIYCAARRCTIHYPVCCTALYRTLLLYSIFSCLANCRLQERTPSAKSGSVRPVLCAGLETATARLKYRCRLLVRRLWSTSQPHLDAHTVRTSRSERTLSACTALPAHVPTKTPYYSPVLHRGDLLLRCIRSPPLIIPQVLSW
jgi:hypothetical protein